jgi:hypothetical protein
VFSKQVKAALRILPQGKNRFGVTYAYFSDSL